MTKHLRLRRAMLALAVAGLLALGAGATSANAHTVSRTANWLIDPYISHCLRRSISLREYSGGMQMYGYQMFLQRDCASGVSQLGDTGTPVNQAILKLFIYNGSGPYLGGYSICRNVVQNYPWQTSAVSNAFSNYSRGPCGAGYYAAAICTNQVGLYSINPSLYTRWDTYDCGGPENLGYWVWTDDWHYFA